MVRTEEHILQHNRLLCQSQEVRTMLSRTHTRRALLLYPCPRKIYIEQQQQNPEPYNCRLFLSISFPHPQLPLDISPYIKLISLSHQRIMQQMPIDLRFDQDQVYKDNHEVMFDVFVTELAAVLAYC